MRDVIYAVQVSIALLIVHVLSLGPHNFQWIRLEKQLTRLSGIKINNWNYCLFIFVRPKVRLTRSEMLRILHVDLNPTYPICRSRSFIVSDFGICSKDSMIELFARLLILSISAKYNKRFNLWSFMKNLIGWLYQQLIVMQIWLSTYNSIINSLLSQLWYRINILKEIANEV